MRLLLAIPSGSRQEEFVHSPGRVNADRILEHAMVENGSASLQSFSVGFVVSMCFAD